MKRPPLMIAIVCLTTGFLHLALQRQPETPQMLAGYQPQSAEALLANGKPIPLSTADLADLADLLLIPRIGDTLASAILNGKGRIVAQSLILDPQRPAEDALMVIHGIGPKTAARLRGYLSVRDEP